MDDIDQRLKFSLRLKFFLLISIIIISSGISICLLFFYASKKQLVAEIDKRGISAAKSFAYNVEYGVLTENRNILEKIIEGSFQKPDIIYVEVTGDDNEILAQKSENGYNLFRDKERRIVELEDKVHRLCLTSDNGAMAYQFTAPILTDENVNSKNRDELDILIMGEDEQKTQPVLTEIGSVKVCLSLASLNKKASDVFFIGVFIIFSISTIAIIISLYFINILIKPVKKIAEIAMEISKGNFDKSVEIHTYDEIGIMADNFNRMTLALRSYINELEQFRNKLEQRVEERTNDLQHTNDELKKAYDNLKKTQLQLIHSEKMASLGLLIAGVAHEINNPINFISSGIDTLKERISEVLILLDKYKELEDDPSKELPEFIKEVCSLKQRIYYDETTDDIKKVFKGIDEGVDRTVRIVKDLKQISGNRNGKTCTISIKKQIESTLNILSSQYKSRIEFDKEFTGNNMIECYPDQINAVLMNVLSNAVQSIKHDGVIKIKTSRNDTDLLITVSDTGDGIAEENLAKIFDPFFTTKDVGSGMGLGLSLSYEIIRNHNGEISVKSEPGKGSEFTIKLPVMLNKHASNRDK